MWGGCHVDGIWLCTPNCQICAQRQTVLPPHVKLLLDTDLFVYFFALKMNIKCQNTIIQKICLLFQKVDVLQCSDKESSSCGELSLLYHRPEREPRAHSRRSL